MKIVGEIMWRISVLGGRYFIVKSVSGELVAADKNTPTAELLGSGKWHIVNDEDGGLSISLDL